MSFRGRPGRIVVFGALAIVVAALAIGAALALITHSDGLTVEVLQDGLEHPWDVAFAADGRMIVTERAGRVLVFAGSEPEADLLATTTVPDVRAELESGLMGVAVVDDTVYLCASREPSGEPWRVDLMRATFAADSTLESLEPVPIGATVGGPRHQGCAVEADEAHLWLSVGDGNAAGAANPAQDPGSSSGKVLRLALDGSIPSDNPFGPESPVFSVGHRNPQGLALRPGGLVVEVEHGTDENDEINVLVPGANYGYPCRTGRDGPGPFPEGCPGVPVFVAPAWASGRPTIATSGATFLVGPAWSDWDGDLVVTTLKDTDLRRFDVTADGTVTAAGILLDGQYGRLRAAVIGPDGALYLGTSNGENDRILRITRED
jgi:glucose/arabinose dehydrogenase